MPYTHTTFAQAKQRLANELGDSGKVYFVDAELGRYLIEALRWWGLVSMYFRETLKLDTVPGQAFYRIEDDLTNLAGTEFPQGFSVTDRQLINDINYALMEPQITNWALPWPGTEMFSLDEIVQILIDSRDEMLKLSGAVLNNASFPTVLGQNRVALSESYIRTVRASIFEFGSGGPLPIWAVDQAQLQTTVNSAIIPASGRPLAFSVSYSPQLTLDLWPSPLNPSDLILHFVMRGATLTPSGSETALGVPDDASILLKYRTIADLLSGDGLARAPMMAAYCEKRYKEGLEALMRYQSLMWAEVGGKRAPLTSVAQLDQMKPTWERSTGAPRSVAQLNWDTFALSPTPDDIYTLTFEAVRRAPIPAADGDFIQVGTESLQAIYDYAQHIALFKSQGSEFMNSLPRYDSAMELAMDYREQIASQSVLYRETQLPPNQDRWSRPYKVKGAVDSANADRQREEV